MTRSIQGAKSVIGSENATDTSDCTKIWQARTLD